MHGGGFFAIREVCEKSDNTAEPMISTRLGDHFRGIIIEFVKKQNAILDKL